MKRTIKNTLKFQILAILLILAIGAKAQQTDFSGTWERDTEKCDPGSLSINSTPVELIINQNSNGIEITRNSKNKQGDASTYTEKPTFNSTKSTAVVKAGMNKQSGVEWLDDHKRLVLTATYTDDQGKEIQKAKEGWVLSDDGKTLTIKAVLNVNGQDYLLTEVFDKK